MRKKFFLLLSFLCIPLSAHSAITIGQTCLQKSVIDLLEPTRPLDVSTLTLAEQVDVRRAVAEVTAPSEEVKKIFPVKWDKALQKPLTVQEINKISKKGWYKNLTAKMDFQDKPELRAELNLTAEEGFAIALYTASGFSVINSVLRDSKKINSLRELTIGRPIVNALTDEEIIEFFQDYPRLLNSGIQKLPATPAQVVRRAGLDPALFDKLNEGTVFSFQTYTSTTLNSTAPALAGNDGNVQFLLQQKTGRNVEILSKYPHEKEVLLLPYRPFLISKVERAAEKITVHATEL